MALLNGTPLHVVAARAGDHPNTILSTYAHVLSEADEQAAERFAALIDG